MIVIAGAINLRRNNCIVNVANFGVSESVNQDMKWNFQLLIIKSQNLYFILWSVCLLKYTVTGRQCHRPRHTWNFDSEKTNFFTGHNKTGYILQEYIFRGVWGVRVLSPHVHAAPSLAGAAAL